jgi:hypothetical protein
MIHNGNSNSPNKAVKHRQQAGWTSLRSPHSLALGSNEAVSIIL